MSVAVIVPYYSSDLHRERAWNFVRDWWKINFPDWHLLQTGAHPFNKARAVNLGVQSVSADTLIIADADCFVAATSFLMRLVESVEDRRTQWVVPHRMVHKLSEKESQVIYEGQHPIPNQKKFIGCVGGGLVVLSRESWDTVNGMDERYEGWGGEDVSFGMALQCLVGLEHRGTLDLYHLWHPPQTINYKMPEKSTRLIQEYRKAQRYPDKMKELVK